MDYLEQLKPLLTAQLASKSLEGMLDDLEEISIRQEKLTTKINDVIGLLMDVGTSLPPELQMAAAKAPKA